MVLTRGSLLRNNRKPSLRLVYDWFSIGFRLVFDWFSIGKPSLGQRRRCRGHRGGGERGQGCECVGRWDGSLCLVYFLLLTSYYFLCPCSAFVKAWDDVVTQTVGGNNPAPVQRCRHSWFSCEDVAKHKSAHVLIPALPTDGSAVLWLLWTHMWKLNSKLQHSLHTRSLGNPWLILKILKDI